ncbi:11515_t:CDS:1, partial [Gigaspora rosea]
DFLKRADHAVTNQSNRENANLGTNLVFSKKRNYVTWFGFRCNLIKIILRARINSMIS